MATPSVYNIQDIPTKRAIMALADEVSALRGQLTAMTTRNGVAVNQFGLDEVPTQGSDNAVASGGTYTAIANAVSKESVTKATSYIQGGNSYTAIFGNLTLSRFGRCVTLFINVAKSPRVLFPTTQSDVTILEAAAMPTAMRPAVNCRFFGGCTWHTSASASGGYWGYAMLDVNDSGRVNLRGLFKQDGTRLGTSDYLMTLALTGTWMTAGG